MSGRKKNPFLFALVGLISFVTFLSLLGSNEDGCGGFGWYGVASVGDIPGCGHSSPPAPPSNGNGNPIPVPTEHVSLSGSGDMLATEAANFTITTWLGSSQDLANHNAFSISSPDPDAIFTDDVGTPLTLSNSFLDSTGGFLGQVTLFTVAKSGFCCQSIDVSTVSSDSAAMSTFNDPDLWWGTTATIEPWGDCGSTLGNNYGPQNGVAFHTNGQPICSEFVALPGVHVDSTSPGYITEDMGVRVANASTGQFADAGIGDIGPAQLPGGGGGTGYTYSYWVNPSLMGAPITGNIQSDGHPYAQDHGIDLSDVFAPRVGYSYTCGGSTFECDTVPVPSGAEAGGGPVYWRFTGYTVGLTQDVPTPTPNLTQTDIVLSYTPTPTDTDTETPVPTDTFTPAPPTPTPVPTTCDPNDCDPSSDCYDPSVCP